MGFAEPTSIQMEEQRPLKRKLRQPQSPLACEACRLKKVRCDVTGRRARCSRCERSGVTCSIVPGKRRHLVQRILGVKPSSPASHTGYESTSSPHSTDTASPSTASEGPHSPFSTSSWGSYASSATSASMLSVSSRSWSDHRYQPHEGIPLPAYIKPLLKLSPSEYEALEAAGCFNLPDAETRKEIIETYGRWVHSTLPMLDPSQLQCISAGGPSMHQVSLLLLKSIELAAILCSGRQFHDSRDLVRQVEALLKAMVECDPLEMLQVLILLTFSDGDGDISSNRDSYHWMGVASRYAARLLGTGRLTKDCQKSVRATFWSLVVRDSIVSLAARKPLQVSITACSTLLRLPTEDDWFCPATHQADGGRHGVTPRELCQSLYEISEAARAALGVKLSQDSSTGAASGTSHRLRVWHSRWHGILSRMACQEGDDGSVHGAVILAYWSLAVMTLHCWSVSPQATPSAPDPELVSVALATTTAVYSRLHEQSNVRYVPNTAVAALVPAAVAHLMNSTSDQPETRASNSQKYYTCWQVLRELHSKYRTAHQAMRMLDSLGQEVRQKIDSGNVEHIERLRDWCNRASASGMTCE